MTRTLNQRMADSHERDIAEWIGGSQTKASGSQWHAQGDAKNNERKVPFPITADGKSTLGRSISVTQFMWRKIVEQTFGQIPTLFLRFYRDESLRIVEEDLVVLRSREFMEILEAARKWREHNDQHIQAMAERARHPLLEAKIEPSTGCDCCR